MGSKEAAEGEGGAVAQRVMYVDTSNEPKTDEEAVAMITKALGCAREAGDRADLYFNLGNAQERRGFPESAEAAYRACLGADAERSDAANNLALVLMRRGAYDEAVALQRRALASGAAPPARRAELWTNLGVALEHAAPPRPTEAAEAYEAAVKESGGRDARPLTNLAQVLCQVGDHGAAVDAAERAVGLAPGDAFVRYNLAAALDGAGDAAGAAVAYRAALELKPDLASAHTNLAVLLEEGGEADAALHHYELAAAHDPADYDAKINLAACLRARGDAAAAAAAYAAAAAHAPDEPAAWLALAEDRGARGDIDGALDCAKRAVKAAAAAGGDDAEAAASLLRELLVLWRDSLDETQVLASALDAGAVI